MRCPKCQTTLRLNALPGAAQSFQATLKNSTSPAGMRNLLKDCMAGGGDDAAGGGMWPSDGEESGTEKRAMSPEELLANMTDEDLLFGSPSALAPKGKSTVGRSMPTSGGAAYKDKT